MHHWIEAALRGIRNMGAWGPAAFITLYVSSTVALIPGSVLTLGAGALFGVLWGTIYVSIASVTGASLAFVIGRYLAKSWVSRKMEGNQKLKRLSKAVAKEGWKLTLLVRLSPVFPFNILNYAFGLTEVSFRDYVLASWLGMLPGTILYVYLGSLAKDLAQLGLDRNRHKSPAEWALEITGLAATAAVTVVISRLAKRALNEGFSSVPDY
ncbi:MAG TPA: TVP38/TMEM64 family protein [Elusimicrobiota bacterium]|nr:TVP38/TMEM64 family protein [Elusimicrobiota bacterium]